MLDGRSQCTFISIKALKLAIAKEALAEAFNGGFIEDYSGYPDFTYVYSASS